MFFIDEKWLENLKYKDIFWLLQGTYLLLAIPLFIASFWYPALEIWVEWTFGPFLVNAVAAAVIAAVVGKDL